jgi:hypothetical protein
MLVVEEFVTFPPREELEGGDRRDIRERDYHHVGERGEKSTVTEENSVVVLTPEDLKRGHFSAVARYIEPRYLTLKSYLEIM